MDPDPGGPKTYGSEGSGFGSATLFIEKLTFLFIFLSAMLLVTGRTIFKNGVDYVDQPKLVYLPPAPRPDFHL